MEHSDILKADVAIIGGGLGACAAALAAAKLGRQVILTEETQWIGGQLTNQAVPPDEHPWIEHYGATATYRQLRNNIRSYYRQHLPLTAAARADPALNPGNGWVSQLCHDPRVALAVLQQMLLPYELSGKLFILNPHRPITTHTQDDRIVSVVVRGLESNRDTLICANYFIDATPQGELLELGRVEHVLGAESQRETEEPHALPEANPLVQQSITVCFAMDYREGEDHRIARPSAYDFWRNFRPTGWPGSLLNFTSSKPETHEPLTRTLFGTKESQSLWTFRRILDSAQFEQGFARSDLTVVNWPQNDYWLGPICGVSQEVAASNLESARQLSLSLLYWLQTEAPRPDGGSGYAGLHLRGDVVGGTPDGLAPIPYIRESRRIRALFTVLEQHIAYPLRKNGPEIFRDSVGIGCYRIDLHPRVGGEGYLDLGCWPFQIPLGSLIPVRVQNLLPGGKNLGVTHITNGCFRLHPVEWNIGEVAGLLAAFCMEKGKIPRQVRESESLLDEFQSLLRSQGIELAWPTIKPI